MEITSSYTLNTDQFLNYRNQQLKEDAKRIVNDNYEPVNYQPGSSLRFWVNAEAQDYKEHLHPAIEIIMPLENIYTVFTEQKEFHLNPGDILIIPPGELHHLVAPPSGIRLIYLFDPSIISQIRGYSYLLPYFSQPILINRITCESIYDTEADLMIQMCNNYFSDDSLREILVYANMINFFVCYGHYRMSQDNIYRHSGARKQKKLQEKLNAVLDYLDQNYMENVTLDQAADVAGFSKYHFSRIFKQCSGYNFNDYLSYLRIKSAEMLLIKSELSITEIAMQTGFSSLSTFNRTFKKIKNCTPSEYRSLYDRGVHSL